MVLRKLYPLCWAGALEKWLAPLPFTPEFGVRFPVSAVWKKQKMFLPHPRVKVSIVGSLRDREVACSASDRQASNFESCVWRTVSSQSSHHPQEVLLAQFSLYVHKGGLKPDSFHFINPCAAVMFVSIFHSFKAGIASAISSFKWVKNNITYKKMKCVPKLQHLQRFVLKLNKYE